MSSTIIALSLFAAAMLIILGMLCVKSSLFSSRDVTERSVLELIGLNWLWASKASAFWGKCFHAFGVIAASLLAYEFGIVVLPALVIAFGVYINVAMNVALTPKDKQADDWWKEQIEISLEEYLELPEPEPQAAVTQETFADRWETACLRAGLVNALDKSGQKGTPPLIRKLSDGIIIDAIGYDEETFERAASKIALTIRRHIHRAETLPDGTMKLYFQGRDLPKLLRLKDMKPSNKIVFGECPTGLVESSPEDWPHGMLAGTSGSGKSTGLVWLAYQFVQKYPDAVVFYAGVKARDFEMFDLFKSWPNFVDARNAEQFTAAITELERERVRREDGKSSMRNKVFMIVDEYNALINEGNLKIVESLVTLARSANYHIWLASQRPTISDSAISGIVRENLSMRWCFKVKAKRDSMIMLESPAAFRMRRNPGRAIVLDLNTDKSYEAQCPMITKADVIALVKSHKCIVNPFAQVLRDVIDESERIRKEQQP